MAHRALRVAIFTDVFPRISNTFILNQITGLIDRGHHVDIFATSAGDFEAAHQEVEQYRLAERMRHIEIPRNRLRRAALAALLLAQPRSWRRPTIDALDFRRHGLYAVKLTQLYTVLSFLRHSEYDVIHAQFGKLAPRLVPLIRHGVLAAPLVVSFRGADLTSWLAKNPRGYDTLLGTAKLFLPVSALFANRLQALGAPADRVAVLRSGIALQRFRFEERRREPGEDVRLLFIGRLTEKKGLLDALEAVRRVLESGRNVEFTIVGDGELERTGRAQADAAGIGESVRWLGKLPSEAVHSILQRSHILIAPSRTAENGDQEGIPNVLKEAMACGLPVLSTRHSGIPELVDDGLSGYLVPEGDPVALSQRLLQLIDDPGRWPEMGRAGHAKVEKEYDSEQLNDRLVELYRSAIGERESKSLHVQSLPASG
jgi:colanic acid/amylovoran biosynthesis glycosyltransferase